MKQITQLEQDYFNSKINWNKFESEKESIQKNIMLLLNSG